MWHILKLLGITLEDIQNEISRTGTINHYNPKVHKGTQPIRVLHWMLLMMFQSSNPSFPKEILELLIEKKINNDLNLVFGEEPIIYPGRKSHTPRVDVDTKSITIHETFLSYLWCISYAIYITYIDKIDNPRLVAAGEKITHPVSQEAIDKVDELLSYGTSLIKYFYPWDKDELPNPEKYEASDRDFPEQSTLLYTEAVKFILCHEFAHLKLHVEQINEHTSEAALLQFEIEADTYAIDVIIKGLNEINRVAVENGVVISVLSMLFFKSTTTGKIHPNTEDRLTMALQRLAPHENNVAWGMACIGLQMWDKQFGLSLKWDKSIKSYKEQYYQIIGQIKQRQA